MRRFGNDIHLYIVNSWNLCIHSLQQTTFLSEWTGGVCGALSDESPLEHRVLISTFIVQVGCDPVNKMNRKNNPSPLCCSPRRVRETHLSNLRASSLQLRQWSSHGGLCLRRLPVSLKNSIFVQKWKSRFQRSASAIQLPTESPPRALGHVLRFNTTETDKHSVFLRMQFSEIHQWSSV